MVPGTEEPASMSVYYLIHVRTLSLAPTHTPLLSIHIAIHQNLVYVYTY